MKKSEVGSRESINKEEASCAAAKRPPHKGGVSKGVSRQTVNDRPGRPGWAIRMHNCCAKDGKQNSERMQRALEHAPVGRRPCEFISHRRSIKERIMEMMSGVDDGARTRDNRNHNPGLYQLSYTHHIWRRNIQRQAAKITWHTQRCQPSGKTTASAPC